MRGGVNDLAKSTTEIVEAARNLHSHFLIMDAKVPNTRNNNQEDIMYNYLSLHRTKGWMKFFTGQLLIALAILVIGFSLTWPQIASAQESGSLPAPTILSPPASKIVTPDPLFTGVTVNDTQVLIYINGVLNGEAKVKNGPTGTASWGYTPDSDLPLGEHMVYTVAKSQTSNQQSGESVQLKFYVELPFPAPTLFEPVVDNRTSYNMPWVKGVAKNNSLVDIYIDGHLDGTIQVANQPSGTTNFEYQPKTKLSDGWHAINATAQDRRGKQSKWSQAVVFEIRSDDQIIGSTAPQLSAKNPGTPTSVTAPTLLEPQTGSVVTQGKPIINGLAHNEQSIEVFINGQLNGEINKQQHESGVFSFSYKPFLSLPVGVHTITARSVDSTGNKSAHSNMLSFLIRPKDVQLVISPTGVERTRLVQIPGTVAAISTEKSDDSQMNEVTEEAISDEQELAEETKLEVTKTPVLAMPEKTNDGETIEEPEIESINVEDEPELTNEEITVTDDSSQGFDEKLIVTSDEGATSTDVVVIGERSTATAETTERSGNTALVVVLAIAAIIIIGLISWYTSREDHDNKPDDSANSKTPETPEASDEDGETFSPAKTDSVWEEEPVETDALKYSNESVDDEFPPPPPPPALGI